MRVVIAWLLVCLGPAAAQVPVPDTTAPALYWPLEVGNQWEYEDYWGFGGPTTYSRIVLVDDTVVAGNVYFEENLYTASPGSSWSLLAVTLVRFDSSTARLVQRSAGGDVARTCQLNAAFWALVDCYDWDGPKGTPEETMVSGGYAATVRFWRSGQELVVPAVKSYATFVDAGAETYAATIGYVGVEGRCCNDGYLRIRYARVGGVEYGEHIPVPTDPPPVGRALSLMALPNPAVGRFMLTIGLPAAGDVVIEAFDMLGRRVHRTEMALPAGFHEVPLDAGRWAPGRFLIRANAGGVNVSTSVVRR